MRPLALTLCFGFGLAGCGVTTILARDPLAEGARRIPDLRYHPSPLDADRRSLDLFLPAGPGPHPVVVFIHGGFWKQGGRRADYGIYQRMGRRLANQGVAAAILSYRLAPAAHHPSQVNDVARAVAEVLERAPSFGGDPRRVFVVGHSAGAHLALLVGWDRRWLQGVGHTPKELAGIVAISGPSDLEDLATTWAGERNVPLAFTDDRRRWGPASPVSHLGPGLPPTWLALADGDFPVLLRQNEALAARLIQPGRPHRLIRVEDRDHATIITRLFEPGDPLGAAILEWIRPSPGPARAPGGSAPGGT